MKLEKIIMIKATLRCLTGLHIGAGDAEMHIGGIDKPVIRHPLTQRPYLPGSSLKGKMRSLLEWRSGAVQSDPFSWTYYKKNHQEEVLHILQLFGTGASDQINEEEAKVLGPSRLSFWDCSIPEDWFKYLDDLNELSTEAKAENSMNRITGSVKTPRENERVIAGTPFEFRLSLKRLDIDSEKLLTTVLVGMRLMELDSLGGSGSRGYGKIAFENLTIDGQDYQAKFEAIDPFKQI